MSACTTPDLKPSFDILARLYQENQSSRASGASVKLLSEFRLWESLLSVRRQRIVLYHCNPVAAATVPPSAARLCCATAATATATATPAASAPPALPTTCAQRETKPTKREAGAGSGRVSLVAVSGTAL